MNSNTTINFGLMAKKVTYEIDFQGRDSVSGVASKIVSEVRAMQAATSGIVGATTKELTAQGAAVSALAKQNAQAFQTVESGATKAMSGTASAYREAFDTISSEVQNGTANLQQQLSIQRKVVKDLEKEYREMVAKRDSAPTTYAKKQYAGKADTLRAELDGERQALAAMEQAQSQYKNSVTSVRTQLMNLRNEMARLRMEGKSNTAEYDEMRAKMEQLGTAYRELQTEQLALSTGATQWGGLISGMQGLMGLYSAGSGVVSLFTKDNERLMEVQTKMQSVMAIMMGMQQVANTLHATSAFRIVTVRKVTDLWRAAQNRLTVSLGVSTVAAKAFMAAATMGASVIIGTVISAIDRFVSKKRDEKQAQEEAAKAQEDAMASVRSSVANSVASQLLNFRKLQSGWAAVGADARKQQKFVKDNQKAFEDLGVSITTARDAENLLVTNESAFVQSLKRKAMAAAAMELAAQKYKSAVEKMLQAEDARKVTDEDRKNAQKHAQEVYLSQFTAGMTSVERGQISGNEKKIKNDAYRQQLPTYGQQRAKALTDAAQEEIAAGDKYFDAILHNEQLAADLLSGSGIAMTNGSNGDSQDTSPKVGSIAAIEKKLQELRSALKNASAEERTEIQKDINVWQQKLDTINEGLAALSVPANPTSLADFDAIINHHEQRLKKANKNERAEIVATINQYKAWKAAVEDSITAMSLPATLESFDDISASLSYYESLLNKTSGASRQAIQMIVDDLRALQSAVSVGLLSGYDFGDLEKLDTFDKLETALNHYQTKMQTASEAERTQIQATIAAIDAKRAAMSRSLDIPAMQQEVANLGGLDRETLKLELELIGLEGVREQIRNLQTMLDDTNNPLNNEQRKQVEGLITTWRGYEGQLEKSSLSLRDAWGAVKGIGSGIDGITQALEGNGTAWEKTIAIVDGMFQIYDGISSVVGMIETLVAASQALSAAKTAEAAATTTATAAQVAGATTAVATSAAETAAATNATTAYVAEAAAKTMSAHAGIPWVGIAIGAGMIAAMVGVMLGLPKFADGGIAYGPTLGLFGEYSGAQNNPEVVAPLNKLRSLIEPAGGVGGDVEFRIEGRTLVGLLNKMQNIRNRTK